LGENRGAIVEQISQKLPVKRIGRPEEVADAVLFLMNNGFATGTTLLLDGGDALV
jgi:NAD(P)-dependent dehydrogenase (short-subunit alcohol dehydrogenase family)